MGASPNINQNVTAKTNVNGAALLLQRACSLGQLLPRHSPPLLPREAWSAAGPQRMCAVNQRIFQVCTPGPRPPRLEDSVSTFSCSGFILPLVCFRSGFGRFGFRMVFSTALGFDRLSQSCPRAKSALRTAGRKVRTNPGHCLPLVLGRQHLCSTDIWNVA